MAEFAISPELEKFLTAIPEHQHEDLKELAARHEFDGGMTRAEAAQKVIEDYARPV